jgi:hypothetical protein
VLPVSVSLLRLYHPKCKSSCLCESPLCFDLLNNSLNHCILSCMSVDAHSTFLSFLRTASIELSLWRLSVELQVFGLESVSSSQYHPHLQMSLHLKCPLCVCPATVIVIVSSRLHGVPRLRGVLHRTSRPQQVAKGARQPCSGALASNGTYFIESASRSPPGQL